MTYQTGFNYYPLLMERLQYKYKGAFVIQFREETDITAGRVEGRVEHMATYQATHFHTLDELLGFIARVLAEVNKPEQQ